MYYAYAYYCCTAVYALCGACLRNLILQPKPEKVLYLPYVAAAEWRANDWWMSYYYYIQSVSHTRG